MNYSHLKSYYKGKRVFITGHTGFKGSWMLKWLSLMETEVKGYSLPPQNENDNFNLINGSKLCHSVFANILDKAKLITEITEFQPDYIFHLAAQPLVRPSYENPAETFFINSIGTAYVLDAVRLLKNKCAVVLITTDKVYENKEWNYPYRENDRLGGYDPYSASKACAELVINSYRNSFFNLGNINVHKKSIASARAGNVIGGGDWSKDRIIPDLVRALMIEEPALVRNPDAIRPWQHVLEPIGGYLHLATKMMDDPIKYAEAWNFGPYSEDNMSVKDLSRTSISQWGKGEFYTPELINQPHEASLLKLDISNTINELGWKPQYNSKKSIELTIEWYKSYYSNGYSITEEQVLNFAE